MRIAMSTINLASSQISGKVTESYEHLRQWGKSFDTTQDNHKANGAILQESTKKKDVLTSLNNTNANSSQSIAAISGLNQEDAFTKMKDEFIGNVKEQIMKDMIEMITGKKIKILTASDLSDSNGTSPATAAAQSQKTQPQDWGIDYSYKETTTTTEGVAVAASGTVTTADGKTIDFNASLQMTHQTSTETSISVKAGDALIDPLMIDLSGSGVSLSEATFKFDINDDGTAESIHAPNQQSGFLAYDKNGNGVIDDGSELFGPKSGNGFIDLSKYDSDKNGWIDENDAIFNDLKILQKSSNGSDTLTSLKEIGIGAIYTGTISSKFNITSGTSQFNPTIAGIVQKTGIFLRENGPAGFIQEVDLKA